MRGAILLAAVCSLMVLASCGAEQAPPVPKLTSTDTQVNITGTGTVGSPPFQIKLDGSYKAYWKAAKQQDGANDASGCPMKAQMVSAQKDIGFFRTVTTDGAPSTIKPGMMESKAFNLHTQRYAFDVTTDCSWQIVLERQLQK